ncbi:hypothetical protein D822_04039 [Streptococcus ratti FA-1 = DSM 20564]|uniref:Transposase n=2 Tax=Streptococcus ratti TaxID=1341 RepID=A0ABN0GXB9_STRRT|nr:hypothetical protein SRA_00118 [Streptococcus ratti FA-1 = DSM 20564]EMP70520.1 hypothetical protein D822_04039 [Streptococcus ratti FA-1 = DSM 20564]QEY08053.1 hypothetical protein FY406_05090 [Streptococcus ratti]
MQILSVASNERKQRSDPVLTQKTGSIISVMGKITAEIIELFECIQKNHMTYNEKRSNKGLKQKVSNLHFLW